MKSKTKKEVGIIRFTDSTLKGHELNDSMTPN